MYCHHTLGYVWHLTLILLVTLLMLMLTTRTNAQVAAPPDLIVTVHDVAGAPFAGMIVTVRDAGGEADLAQATTDTRGQATFARLRLSRVRVAMKGQLANGTPLKPGG